MSSNQGWIMRYPGDVAHIVKHRGEASSEAAAALGRRRVLYTTTTLCGKEVLSNSPDEPAIKSDEPEEGKACSVCSALSQGVSVLHPELHPEPPIEGLPDVGPDVLEGESMAAEDLPPRPEGLLELPLPFGFDWVGWQEVNKKIALWTDGKTIFVDSRGWVKLSRECMEVSVPWFGGKSVVFVFFTYEDGPVSVWKFDGWECGPLDFSGQEE